MIVSAAFGQEIAHNRSTSEIKSFESHVVHPVRFQYLIHLPKNYQTDPRERWPLIVYLHGGSGRGSDISLVKQYGPPMVVEKGVDFPFVLLSPQCPEGEFWTDTEGLMALIESVEKDYRIDANRIYLTGVSLGGRGVLYLANKYPGRFAAVVALAPYLPSTAWAKNLTTTPVLIMHGDKDSIAPINDSRELVDAMRQSKAEVEFTILPGRDHFITDIYERNDVYTWLLNHKCPQVKSRSSEKIEP
jgi:predicted peptidase